MAAPSRILVVDDDHAIAEMVGIVLRGKGFDVVTAPDGASALDAFDRVGPDLVLLDLMLPGMDGIEVCRELRRRSGVPVIMLTARSDTSDVVEGLEAGTQILAKDITLPEGVTLDSDEELLVVNITEQISAEALEAELADAEAEAGIEHDESDEAEAAEGAEGAEGDAAEGDDSEQE